MNPLPIQAIQLEALSPASPQLRLAFVTETYPPEVNGVAMTLARIVGEMQRRNHHICLVRPRLRNHTAPGPADAMFEEVLTRGVALPFYKQLRMGLPAKQELISLWSRHRPDLVHIATEGPLGWAALQAARSLSLPVTADFRTRFDQYGQFYGNPLGALGGRSLAALITAYLRHFHNRALCTFVPTLETLQTLERQGFRNLVINGRGVDTVLFDPARRSAVLRARWRRGVSAAAPVLLYVGRLAREKNVELVFAGWRRLREAGCPAALVVVGDGPMRADLEAAHRGAPGVHFTGTLRGDALAMHYASADLFLFPSLTETFGNVTLEAMASGLAVVAFGRGAAGAHVRDRVSGYLVNPGDDAGFISAVALLADDAGLRTAVGRAARVVACQQSWERVLEEFEATLLDARALGAFDDATCMA